MRLIAIEEKKNKAKIGYKLDKKVKNNKDFNAIKGKELRFLNYLFGGIYVIYQSDSIIY
jgi:hypothetical protein